MFNYVWHLAYIETYDFTLLTRTNFLKTPKFSWALSPLAHPFGLISSSIFFYFRSVLIANWHTMEDWTGQGRTDGLKADGSCLAPLAVIFGRCHFEAIRGGQAHLATNPRSHCLLLSLSLCPSTKWGQQSSEQIGLLFNCLVNGYNDTINCMSAAQLALKSGTRPSPTPPPASLTPTSHTGYMPCPFAAAAANMNYFFWQNLICLK